MIKKPALISLSMPCSPLCKQTQGCASLMSVCIIPMQYINELPVSFPKNQQIREGEPQPQTKTESKAERGAGRSTFHTGIDR